VPGTLCFILHKGDYTLYLSRDLGPVHQFAAKVAVHVVNVFRNGSYMKKIFISYRRDDTAPYALGISQYLQNAFGRKSVFIDVDMTAGTKFPQAIDGRLRKCKVMLALIGPNWLVSHNNQGRSRLEDPEDWVRIEIARALKRKITVIPVRIDGAKLPDRAVLPADMRGLLDHQAVTLSTETFRNEMNGLARDIRAIRKRRPFMRIAIAIVVALVLLWMLLAILPLLLH
jgi:hypothetical protein